MNCEKSRELFADYLGEELDRRDAQERIQLAQQTLSIHGGNVGTAGSPSQRVSEG